MYAAQEVARLGTRMRIVVAVEHEHGDADRGERGGLEPLRLAAQDVVPRLVVAAGVGRGRVGRTRGRAAGRTP